MEVSMAWATTAHTDAAAKIPYKRIEKGGFIVCLTPLTTGCSEYWQPAGSKRPCRAAISPTEGKPPEQQPPRQPRAVHAEPRVTRSTAQNPIGLTMQPVCESHPSPGQGRQAVHAMRETT